MKRFLVAVAVVAQLGFSGTASAILVDFSTLNNPVDITNTDFALDGVTISYDDLGSGIDFASVDSTGIYGTTYGNLVFEFDAPVSTLNFDFSLQDATSDITEALFISYDNNNNPIADMLVSASFTPYDPADLSLGEAFGTLAYSGAAFDRAQMYFSTDAPYFSVSNLNYTPETSSPVPEPTTLLLMASGLAGFGGNRVFRRKRC